MSKPFKTTISEGIAELVFDHPPVNAFDSAGWAAIAVDSHGPRDFVDSDIWRLICAGQLLMGSERAGDVLVSIYDARRLPFVDPDRLALVGASHGGWAIMELLAFEKVWRLPFNLTALPEGAVEQGFAGGDVSRNFGANGDHDSLQ